MATVAERHIQDKSTSVRCVVRGLGMFSTFSFPGCYLGSSPTLNCMIFATLPSPPNPLSVAWQSARSLDEREPLS